MDTDLDNYETSPTDIAIVGMAVRVAGARSLAQFWQNIRDGVVSIGDVELSDQELIAKGVSPADLRNPNYVRKGGVIEDVASFDPGFFGIGARDAAIMDPQHRHFIECVWESLENAGYVPESFDGAIGVYAGCGMNEYMTHNLLSNQSLVDSLGMFLLRHTGNDKDFLSSGVSYRLDLKGPSLSVQTACSTSLVAVHLAMQGLINGECDLAIAGGVTIQVPHGAGYLYREGEVLSPEGVCRPFDVASNGTVLSSGAGVVVLKTLESALKDGDNIRAVIKASAINNDGSSKVSYLAPSVDGQSAVIAEALSLGEIAADSIQYVETHGTGTAVGDPIEMAALTQAFRASTDKEAFCRIGSAKANIGHTDTAAGVIGLIKTVLALENKTFPPLSNFREPNPKLSLEHSPFLIRTQAEHWNAPGGPRRAGVSSLGVGGTNAHVVVQEAPATDSTPSTQPWQLLPLSARSETVLDNLSSALADSLERDHSRELADVAYTLQTGRAAFEQRRVVVASSSDDAVKVLRGEEKRRLIGGQDKNDLPRVTFLFPGGGTSYPNMSRELYETQAVFRTHVDECLSILERLLEMDLSKVLYPDDDRLEDAKAEMAKMRCSLPSTFIVEYAMAKLLMHFGVEPDAMSGHSLGEYTAACLSGVISLEDALSMVVERSLLIDSVQGGGMLTVPLTEAELMDLLPPDVSLATINTPDLCVVSGTNESIDSFEALLKSRDVSPQRVAIAAAGHSHLLDPILDRFHARLTRVKFHAPERRFISNVTGTWVDPEAVRTPDYWVGHLRNTVRFSQGMTELLKEPGRIFLEVGPGQTLATLARHQSSPPRAALTTMGPAERTRSEAEFFLMTLGRLWSEGVAIDWDILHEGEERRRVPLPSYPFERKDYWIDPTPRSASKSADALTKIEGISNWFSRPVWRRAESALLSAPAEPQRWLVFLDEPGVGAKLAQSLVSAGHAVYKVRSGPRFKQISAHEYVIEPSNRGDYDLLVGYMAIEGGLPDQVVHLWGVTKPRFAGADETAITAATQLGFGSLFYLAQAIGDQDADQRLTLSVVTNGLQSVAGEAVISPEKALLLGPARVIPAEFANITSQAVDIDLLSVPKIGGLDRTVRVLTEELSRPPEHDTIAIRDGQVWTLGHEDVVVEEEGPGRAYLREGGVYLITGGLGTIGLGLAEHLASRYQAKLILTGRSSILPREQWDAWLASHPASDPTSAQLSILKRIEATGGGPLVRAVDVTDRTELAALVGEAVARFGRIDGVFHAAGVFDDALIQTKSLEQTSAVLAPKVAGTLALYAALSEAKPDFLVLFSSTSATLGVPGQVDYAAANAFVDAFAASKAGSARPEVISVQWGVWASAAERRPASAGARTHSIEAINSPIFSQVSTDGDGRLLLSGEMNPKHHWVLDEHRLKDGSAVMPGTGYLELALTGARRVFGEAPAELENLFFSSPLGVGDDETREVHLALTPEADGWSLEVDSADSGGLGSRSLHATGSFAALKAERPVLAELGFEQLDEPAALTDGETGLTQAASLQFGPRWHSLKAVCRNGHSAIGRLELAEAFVGDVERYHLHPALMDVTVGLGLSLLPNDATAGLYVPMACGRVRVWDDLPARVKSYARLASPLTDDAKVVSLDLVVTDDSGRVLVEVKDFSLKHLDAEEAAAFAHGSDAEASQLQAPSSYQAAPDLPPLLALAKTEGIQLEEGMQALERVLARWRLPQVTVSSLPLQAVQRLVAGGSAAETQESAIQRPDLDSEYEAPRDEIEQFLAQAWQEYLGIDRVGISDDFFDLGGHSLIAVRVFARVKKQYGVELPLASLFNAPTIAALAAVLRADLGLSLDAGQAQATADQQPASAQAWSCLVPIQTRGTKPALFCVHGMAGNVLNFRDISVVLGSDQPFYGLQAQGLDGVTEPHRTIEEMAATYIAGIQAVQPHGPYYLGGFSGGGVVAYEMAQQLQAHGEQVALLVCFDSLCPTILRRRSRLGRIKTFVSGLVNGRMDYVAFVVRRKLASRRPSEPANDRLSFEDVPVTGLESSFIEAMERYEVRPLQAKMVLFQARDRSEIALSYIPDDFGWTGFAKRGVEVIVVPGRHTTLVLEPNVRVLAAGLRNALGQARDGLPSVGV
ncbi:MAG TPA: SDR family oxidoreductase [Dehalococcoidia bacterium]|nr:SDR family oxidoreductase [Dehalococcoidia bacterium]